MISIIICSINPERCEKTLENFSKNIGLEHETIVFDNRQNNWGICRVYNHCAEKAKYPFLCFVHEDVFIETENWGKTIVEFIEKIPNCGVVGFAGGFQAMKNLSSWWAGEKRMHLCDAYNGKTHSYKSLNYKNHYYENPDAESFSKVLCVDGLFQFIKKSIWEEIKYDEDNFSGFHFYDVDFSFAVSEKYNNYVLLNYDVFHDSSGNVNEEYINNMFIFQEKWNKKLPKNLTEMYSWKILRAELRETLQIHDYCKNAHIKMGKFFKKIYKTNTNCFFALVLIYIPIKIILNRLTRFFEKIQLKL